MNTWKKLPSESVLARTVEHLEKNGIATYVVETKEEAKAKALELLPNKAEVMDMTSVTLAETGLQEAIAKPGVLAAVKKKLTTLTDAKKKRMLGAAPDYAMGSVHAVTEDGQVVIASNTGSQLPAYAYGAEQVIWVVGAQKIVKNLDEAMKRIYDYVLPLEAERARKAYGASGSNVSKLLIINKEVNPTRLTMIIIKEVIGF